MNSLFITGTDTDVGKTYITAGLAVSLRKMGYDVGVMKPFAAGAVQKKGFQSEDVEIIASAANVDDPEDLINPQFFPIAASPYTAWKTLKTKPQIKPVLTAFKKLSAMHEIVLVEGVGGIMTPILRNYYVTDLIKEMNIPAIIVARNKIGTINHTIMTCEMCKQYKIPIKGIVINDFENGYPINDLKRDLKNLTEVRLLGSIPFIRNFSDSSLFKVFKKHLDLGYLQK